MPVYNSQKYLGRAIESVLKQTYADFEFIIIDDGSTDQSAQIINSFKDHRIKYIKHPQNKGIVRSLNRGIKIARGEYIIRMDADDISRKSRFKTQISYMDSHPEICLCASWINVFGDGKNYIWKTPQTHAEIMARSLFETPVAHPSVIIRRSTLTANQLYFDEDFRYAEDYELWFRLGGYGKLATYPKVLVDYRVHPSQTASKKSTPQQANSLKVRKKILRKLKIKASSEQILLHNEIASWRKIDDFRQLRQWLNTLAGQNEKIGLFDQKALNDVLVEKWLGMLALHQKSLVKKIYFALNPGKNLKLPTLKFAMQKIGL